LPPEVVLKLRQEVGKALQSADVRSRLHDAGGLEPLATSADEFAALIRRDHERYGRLIREIGIKAD